MYGFGDDEFKKRQDELQQMKFGLDDLQKSFSEMPGMKMGNYDVTGRENKNPDTTLGKFDLSSFANKDNVGSIYESFQPQNTDFKSESKGVESLVSGFKSGGSESISGEAGAESLGGLDSLLGGLKSGGAEGSTDALASASGGMDIASSSVAAGMKALTMAKTTSNNDGESVMNGIDMTMKGTKAGMAIGGPWGAAIGGAVGLGYGIYDGFADANQRGRNERNEAKEKFKENKLRREQEFRISEGEDALKNLSKLRKAQMDYLI